MAQIDLQITAACAQINPEFGAVEANINRIAGMTESANVDLIVFPELVTSGYEFIDRDEVFQLAIDLSVGTEMSRFRQLAGDTNTHIVLGLPEKHLTNVFNSAVLIEPNSAVTVYRKIHLFDREKNLFDPGDLSVSVKETAIGRIGMMICFDWIFPETARLLTLNGAQIICHPSNLVLSYCQRSMFARSIENGVFTMTCNRIGMESRAGRELTFTGGSQILSNRGDVLAQAGNDTEETIIAEFDPSDADDKKLTVHNHLLEDRRPELYGRLV